MPAGAIYVGRPTEWGNPFEQRMRLCVTVERPAERVSPRRIWIVSPEIAVAMFRAWALTQIQFHRATGWIEKLRGKDLACWCPLNQPCHADVLLELANSQ